MTDATTWVELYRCEDIYDARAVATSIAGMEFDVRIRSAGAAPRQPHDGDRTPAHGGADLLNAELSPARLRQAPADGSPGDPPYVVEVPQMNYHELRDALDDILDEQVQFDERLRLKQRQRQQFMLGISIIVLAAAIAVAVASAVISDQPRHAPAPVRR